MQYLIKGKNKMLFQMKWENTFLKSKKLSYQNIKNFKIKKMGFGEKRKEKAYLNSENESNHRLKKEPKLALTY